MKKTELVALIGRAIVEDESVETGATHPFAKGLLVEVMPSVRTLTEPEIDGLLTATREHFVEQAGLIYDQENPRPDEETKAEFTRAREAYIDAAWAEARPSLVAALPEQREPVHATITRARDLIVDALNGDDFPETGTAVPLGEHRFRLDLFDGSQWLGTVANFGETYQNELKAYWPELQLAPGGEVFALRVVELRERGGLPIIGAQ